MKSQGSWGISPSDFSFFFYLSVRLFFTGQTKQKNIWRRGIKELWTWGFHAGRGGSITRHMSSRRHGDTTHNTTLTDQEVFSHSRADGADCCRCSILRFPLTAVALVLRLLSYTPAEDLCLPGPTHGHRHTQTAWAPDWSELILSFLLSFYYYHHHQVCSCGFLLPLTTAQEVSCSSSFALQCTAIRFMVDLFLFKAQSVCSPYIFKITLSAQLPGSYWCVTDYCCP